MVGGSISGAKWIAQHSEAIGRLEGLLVKLLDGQAILLQNDMDLKRRLDER